MDYEALSGSGALLSWTSNNNRSCVRVTVLDDDMVENEELFFVNVVRVVESSPPVFPTFPPGTIVMIMNDDGSFCSYLPAIYALMTCLVSGCNFYFIVKKLTNYILTLGMSLVQSIFGLDCRFLDKYTLMLY